MTNLANRLLFPILAKRLLLTIFIGAFMVIETQAADSQELLVFVTSFATGEQGAIHSYRLNPITGQLIFIQGTKSVENPFFIVVSPDEKFLYSIHAPGAFGGGDSEQVAAYQLVARTGQLKLLNRQSARGSAACYLDVDATGKTVAVANYSTGSVATFPVNSDGSLSEAASFFQHTATLGRTPKPPQDQARAHCIVFSPDNRFAFAADLGLDQIFCYRLDAVTGKLTPNQQPFVRTPREAGPRHLTFHPNGKFVYVINELANSVTKFDYDTLSGMLIEQKTISTLPDGFEGSSFCADLKITPDGRFLYGTNRGHDSIASYRIAEDGSLSLVAIEPSLGKGPQNLVITPQGECLICANMPGNNVVVFHIDPQTGALKLLQQPVAVHSPSCLVIR